MEENQDHECFLEENNQVEELKDKNEDESFREKLEKAKVAPQHEVQDGQINRDNRDKSQIKPDNYDLQVKNIERVINKNDAQDEENNL